MRPEDLTARRGDSAYSRENPSGSAAGDVINRRRRSLGRTRYVASRMVSSFIALPKNGAEPDLEKAGRPVGPGAPSFRVRRLKGLSGCDKRGSSTPRGPDFPAAGANGQEGTPRVRSFSEARRRSPEGGLFVTSGAMLHVGKESVLTSDRTKPAKQQSLSVLSRPSSCVQGGRQAASGTSPFGTGENQRKQRRPLSLCHEVAEDAAFAFPFPGEGASVAGHH